ncbi:MAG: hypothetical protein ACR2LL_01835 [Nitrosopumilus sp.]
MREFFKKFTGDTSRGRPCKDCGHFEFSHNLKLLEPDPRAKAYHNKSIRVNCKECSCTQFR